MNPFNQSSKHTVATVCLIALLGFVAIVIKSTPALIEASGNKWAEIVLQQEAERLSEAAMQYLTDNESEDVHLSRIIGHGKRLYSLHNSISCPTEIISKSGHFELKHVDGQSALFYVDGAQPLSAHDQRMAEIEAQETPNAPMFASMIDTR